MSGIVPMTLKGAEDLKAEVKRLINNRAKISEAIAEAAAHGDLKENAEYHAARNEQGIAEARVRSIQSKLSHAEIVDTERIKSAKVVFGAKVTIVDEDTEEEKFYHIVGEDEADIALGKISVTSPLARALIGKKVGDSALMKAPGGDRDYEILSLHYK